MSGLYKYKGLVKNTGLVKGIGLVLGKGLIKVFDSLSNYYQWLFPAKSGQVYQDGSEILAKDYGTGNVDGLIKNVQVATFDGIGYIQASLGELEGLSILEYIGTSIPTIDYDNSRILVTAGNLSYLRLSNGKEFWFKEHNGVVLYSNTYDYMLPYDSDIFEFWSGNVIESEGNYYFEGIKEKADLLITGFDFNDGIDSYFYGFPYKSEATISAPIGNQEFIDADVNNFFYTNGVPNQISIDSFVELLNNNRFFNSIEVIDDHYRIIDMALYNTPKTGSALEACQTFYNGSVTKYASTYGFSPLASASVNTAAINNALADGGYVFVDAVGTHDINGTIYIPSNTTLAFIEGSKVRKTGDQSTYTQIIANAGNKTETANTNIKVLGKGVEFLVNSIDGNTALDLYGIVAQIAFANISNIIVSGVKIPDLGTSQYGFSLTNCINSVVRDVWIEGDKDGFDIMGTSYNIELVNCTTRTLDNSIFLGGSAYAFSAYMLGSVDNIKFKNFTSLYHSGQLVGGAMAYLTANAWLDWASGNSYNLSDRCVSNGRTYIKISNNTQVSTIAPTHSAGNVTLADGITWRMVYDGILYKEDCTNVLFKDCTSTEKRKYLQLSNENSVEMRATYPGAFGLAKFDNIIIDNLDINPIDGICSNVVSVYGNLINGTIKNCNNDFELLQYTSYVMFYDKSLDYTNCDKMTIENCNLDLVGATYKLIGITRDSQASTDHLMIDTLEIKDSIVNLGGTSFGYIIEANYINQLTNVIFNNTVFNVNTVNSSRLFNLGLSDNLGATINVTSVDSTFTLKNNFTEWLIYSYQNSRCNWNGIRDTFNNLERFMYHNENTRNDIEFDECTINTCKYLMAIALPGCEGNLTAINTVFNQPTQYLFFNNQATSTITVDSTGSLGTVDASHVESGINITITGDLP